ncbi:monocarboxylate transporter 5 [Aplysia californica]|uniref:Monocarboxylate transporter 5 n=1 Tax=Aplysia californica TaxID=6500 RepID=A0ABM0K8G2_APLCA|nr:monocarboxylate transporter 5 [Aplysia californica]
MTSDQKPRPLHPVDTGWAWVILFSSFVVHFMSLGYQRSFGMLFVAFQERYGSSSTMISAINGAQSVTYCFLTLVVMNLVVKRVSIRFTCFLGCLFQVVAVCVSSVVPNSIYLIASQGIFYGCGHALIYCPTLYILSLYFDKRRPIATTLASCGASVGGVVFPLLTRYLLSSYGLQGALVLLSAMLLQQLPMILLYTPPSAYHSVTSSSQALSSRRKDLVNSPNAEVSTEVTQELLPHENNNVLTDIDLTTSDSKTAVKTDSTANEIVSGNKTKVPSEFTKVDIQQILALRKPHLTAAVISKSHDIIPSAGSDKDSLLQGKLVDRDLLIRSQLQLPGSHPYFSKRLDIAEALSVSAIDQIASSMPSLLVNKAESFDQKAKKSSQHLTQMVQDEESVDSKSIDVDAQICQSEAHRCCAVPDILKSRPFWLLAIFFVTGSVGTGHPAIFIPPLAKERGLSEEDAAFFLMVSSMVDMFGRLVPGFILHFNIMRPSSVMVIPLMCCAGAYHLTPFFNDFDSLLGLTLTYGLLSSSFWALQTLVVIEVLGMELLAPAIGFYSVFMGFSSGISFPVGGALKDNTGTYSSTFHYFGVLYMMAAISLVLVRCVMRSKSHIQDGSDDNIHSDKNNDSDKHNNSDEHNNSDKLSDSDKHSESDVQNNCEKNNDNEKQSDGSASDNSRENNRTKKEKDDDVNV